MLLLQLWRWAMTMMRYSEHGIINGTCHIYWLYSLEPGIEPSHVQWSISGLPDGSMALCGNVVHDPTAYVVDESY